MSTTERTVHATPEQVWDVLSDGWLYPLWVVGASRMRDVDDTWPEVGARLHHSVGAWPALIDDNTEVEECRPLRMLRMRARAWPTGEADVTLHLEPVGAETRIVMEENAVSGPAVLIPKPLQDPLLAWRNVESLRRLAYLCERRAAR
ncbi:SRPBCC family protein [Nocardioides sp. cx-169]|uniref:SRPBCC family protein n=1 Tax=Nocardioides sp. cx-169 TaxID=2899080 RepID=UPI001E57707B|nr:SRPBCC family protein [Nocardioides sp. cx-169]MCD4534549.1 SRPBCC family protein [Nocardioides sp. cx-169]